MSGLQIVELNSRGNNQWNSGQRWKETFNSKRALIPRALLICKFEVIEERHPPRLR